jgi:hypothetical protein
MRAWFSRRKFSKLISAVALLSLGSALPAFGQTMSAESSETPKRPYAAAITALMPQPRSIDYGDGWLPVKGGFQVEWLGYRNAELDRAVMRFQNDVARRTGLDVGRASAAQLRIDCRGEDKGYLTIDAREHYGWLSKTMPSC